MPDDKPQALVVEDTELGRWAVAHALRANGFEVSIATDRADALGRVAGTRFAVMVTTLAADSDDTRELIDRLRESQPDAGLIFLARQEEAARVSAECGPGAVVLEKPLDIDRVVAAACELVAAKPRPPIDSGRLSNRAPGQLTCRGPHRVAASRNSRP
jgi:DNA-binding NtrC family response regulator